MDAFLKTYQDHQFDDWGSVCSDDFKNFSRKFKNYLVRNLPAGCEVLKHRCNHYDLSGFVKHHGNYIYYRYSWNRFSPVDIYADGCRDGVLIRFAADDNDWRGEYNRFTSLMDMPDAIEEMLIEREEKTA